VTPSRTATARRVPFQQVDVFTQVPFKGNPVAVVFDGDALDAARMQAIARWTNLSETVFVCEPTLPRATYRLRIFTPTRELPFAGHPTIGAAHAVTRHRFASKIPALLIQECATGLVEIRSKDERLYLALPAPSFRSIKASQLTDAAAALRVAEADLLGGAFVDVGPVWLTLQLRDAQRVLAIEPLFDRIAGLPYDITGITVFGLYPDNSPSAVEVRSFGPVEGIPEDPVCGSGNGCVAAIVRRDGLMNLDGYTASQGRCVGRDGRVYVEFDGRTIWIGGHAVTCVTGTLQI
jgi:PhzF family phenazine biosynthesis protein